MLQFLRNLGIQEKYASPLVPVITCEVPNDLIAVLETLPEVAHIYGDGTGDVRVEINGVTVNRDVTLFPMDGLLTLKGTRQELNLRPSQNEVVVVRKGTRSNSAKIKG